MSNEHSPSRCPVPSRRQWLQRVGGFGALALSGLAVGFAAPATTARQDDTSRKEWLQLFNGRDLNDWVIKFARHDEHTLGAAVRGYCEHFKTNRVNAIGVLPLHHVSGVMAWLSREDWLPGLAATTGFGLVVHASVIGIAVLAAPA